MPELEQFSRKITNDTHDPWYASEMIQHQSLPKTFETKMSKMASRLSTEDRSLMNTSKLRKMCDAFNLEQLKIKDVKVTGRKQFDKLMNDQALQQLELMRAYLSTFVKLPSDEDEYKTKRNATYAWRTSPRK